MRLTKVQRPTFQRYYGTTLTFTQAEWPPDAATRASIEADFEEPWGDRRQELVFIGEKLDHAGLKSEFDDCLLTDREMKKWEKIMKSSKDTEIVNERLAQVFDGKQR